MRHRVRAFKGGQSPLRHQAALGSCPCGGHEIWWTAQADAGAARLLPFYIAQRTTIARVREVQIPRPARRRDRDDDANHRAAVFPAAPAALRRRGPATAAPGLGKSRLSAVS